MSAATAADIKTPLTYGDALALADEALCQLDREPGFSERRRERTAKALMAVDSAGRAQAWADKAGPELLAALRAFAAVRDHALDFGRLSGGQMREKYGDNPLDGIAAVTKRLRAFDKIACAAIAKAEGRSVIVTGYWWATFKDRGPSFVYGRDEVTARAAADAV